jgi:hypothetical protein
LLITPHNRWMPKTRSIPYWTTKCLLSGLSSAVTELVLIYESVISPDSVFRCLPLHSWTLNSLTTSVRMLSMTTVSRLQPVYLRIKHPSGAYDQIFITVRQLRACWCGALSLMRGRICHLQLLLAIASVVIFESESCGTLDHILLSQIRDFPFRRLLRLAGLRWRYSNQRPHGIDLTCTNQLRVLL